MAMSSKLPICVLLIFMAVILFTSLDASEDVLIRHRRQLLFPNSTLLQLNIGIGTPSPAQHINVNWAFQANFQLPWNRSQIPFDILEANSGYDGFSRKKRESVSASDVMETGDYVSDAKLYHFYKNVEDLLDGFGENGTSCVLRTLCQLGAHPIHSDEGDDLLHELASFVLNPTNDLSYGVTEKDDEYNYIQAYKDGESGRACTELYSECTTSLVDMFTVLAS